MLFSYCTACIQVQLERVRQASDLLGGVIVLLRGLQSYPFRTLECNVSVGEAVADGGT